ncbi:MAG: hypothetical protein JSU94_01790 [Phycisphaerales bacterium]|nr:MAG: hypothetical protein JSU94_01790 [Phycisphaerales bacterium]
MRRMVTTYVCVAMLAMGGCRGCRERGARYRRAAGIKTRQQEASSTEQLEFRGLDLAAAPRTRRTGEPADLWEERPAGSGSYEIREQVECVYSGLDGVVFHVPEKNCFYIERDPLGSSTLTFYGPFEGDPKQVLRLDDVSSAERPPAR